MFLQKENSPAQDDLARRHLLVQLIHVFSEFHIHSHLRKGRVPEQLVTGCLARRASRHRPPAAGARGSRPPRAPLRPGRLRTSSSDSLCGTEKQLVTSTECLSTVPAEGEREEGGKGGAAGSAGAAPEAAAGRAGPGGGSYPAASRSPAPRPRCAARSCPRWRRAQPGAAAPRGRQGRGPRARLTAVRPVAGPARREGSARPRGQRSPPGRREPPSGSAAGRPREEPRRELWPPFCKRERLGPPYRQ